MTTMSGRSGQGRGVAEEEAVEGGDGEGADRLVDVVREAASLIGGSTASVSQQERNTRRLLKTAPN